MNLEPNAGDHPSLLTVDRHLTGEIDDPAVAAWLDTEAGATHLAGIETSRAAVGPFDADTLRTRAAAEVPRRGANTTRWYVLAALFAAALLATALVVPGTDPGAVDPTYVGVRGTSMEIYQLRANSLRPYDDRAVGEGDVLGFLVDPGAYEGVVLLSIDGEGTTTTHYPADGDAPEPVGARGPLPGSVVLDDAPGPEVFVAVFGQDVPDAVAGLEKAWQTDGMEGVVDWSKGRGDVDAVVVNRR